MATANITITRAWTKVAEDFDNFLLDIPGSLEFEVAATETDTAPIVLGHRLKDGDALTRTVLGSGFVWCRVVDGRYDTTIAVITK